jgi:AraC family transcriptional regulator, regulatory protein of adaptative response / methylated-DNA-[protein]-cysteine methyltransferase
MMNATQVNEDAAWDAVLKKDRHYDGQFVYAAVTTGIYCRPSCPARNPQRRNALIFWTAEAAERQGYIACLRCHPKSLAPAEKSIRAALDYIERHFDQTITLKTLSQASGLSPHHLQGTFKLIVGLSPRAFCEARRISRFKQYVRAGHSIISACYEVGYGSSRALYEKTRTNLGMTPGVYRGGAKGVLARYAIVPSTQCSVLIAGTAHGVCAVLLGKDEDVLPRELREEFPRAILQERRSEEWEAAVFHCQDEDPSLSKLPIDLRRRIFQAKVWYACITRR